MRGLVTAGCALLLLALVSCAKEKPSGREPNATPAAASPASAPRATTAPSIPRKLVRTIDLDLTVAHTPEAADAAQKLAVRLGGYVASMTAAPPCSTL